MNATAAIVGSAVIFALNIYAKEVINFFSFLFSFLVFAFVFLLTIFKERAHHAAVVFV